MKISGIMSKNVISALADESVNRAARLLEQHEIKYLPVMDEQGGAVGILSDRDLETGFGLRGHGTGSARAALPAG